MLTPSTGETRVPACTAGWFMVGSTITRPLRRAGSSRGTSLNSAIGPSYSSPWLAPVNRTVGPSPPRTTWIGTRIAPHALSSRDHGTLREPERLPGASRSTVQETRESSLIIELASILDEQLARHRGEALGTGLGDGDALGDLEAPVLEPQAGHEVEGHGRSQLGPVARPEAHGPLAPVRRVAEADRVAGAVVLADAVARQHREERLGDVLAGVARPRLRQPRLHALEHGLLGVEEAL